MKLTMPTIIDNLEQSNHIREQMRSCQLISLFEWYEDKKHKIGTASINGIKGNNIEWKLNFNKSFNISRMEHYNIKLQLKFKSLKVDQVHLQFISKF